jgi:hypothetical protein
MGHANPALALRVYGQLMRRGDDGKTCLRNLLSAIN